MSGTNKLSKWIDGYPKLNNKIKTDAFLLSDFIRSGESLLKKLPIKKHRNNHEHFIANNIHFYCRKMRFDFLSLHCDQVYEILTDKYLHYLRLEDLSFKASVIFQGLTPTKSLMKEERALPPENREIREYDQALFISEILRSKKCGSHLLESMRRPLKKSKNYLSEFCAVGKLDLKTISLLRNNKGLSYVTIQNNKYLNAEDEDLMEDLEIAIDLVNLDPKSYVGIVRGGVMDHPKYKGQRVFSSGINLKYIARGKISFLKFFLGREMGLISKIQRGLSPENTPAFEESFGLEKPWMAIVDTFAIGGGAQLLLVFDKVIAESDSYMILPAANEGFIPGAANLRLAKFYGAKYARRLINDGIKLRANDVDAKHFFDVVSKQEDLNILSEIEAEKLISPGAVANRRMLRISEETEDLFREYMSEFCLNQVRCIYNTQLLSKIASSWTKVRS